jgi:hypothetical protein
MLIIRAGKSFHMIFEIVLLSFFGKQEFELTLELIDGCTGF